MNLKPSRITRKIEKAVLNPLETDHGQLRRVPNAVLMLTTFLCANVLLQGIGDIVLKLLSYTDFLPALPWRTDFLFLTAVSVLMGYRTLQGMRHLKFDVTRNSIELGLLVEIGLIIGDLEFIHLHMLDIPHVVFMRVPFIGLTSLNILILLYISQTLSLRKWWWLR